MVVQGDIGAFEGMHWGHQSSIVSLKEAEEEDFFFFFEGVSALRLISFLENAILDHSEALRHL